MTQPDQRLRHLATLFLCMAHRADDYLSVAELHSITDKLHGHEPGLDWAHVQDLLMESLEEFAAADDADALGLQAAAALQGALTREQMLRILDDLAHIAGADGVVLDDERTLLARLARRWQVSPSQPAAAEPQADADWGVLHDLAYIYLHLAHATDNELSAQEMQVMRNKLHEWQPEYPLPRIPHVLDTAMARYARGEDEALLERAIVSVRDNLPHASRMDALNDLIKIANADGIFLDIEEDMINHLVAVWDVDPHASYGRLGGKGELSD